MSRANDLEFKIMAEIMIDGIEEEIEKRIGKYNDIPRLRNKFTLNNSLINDFCGKSLNNDLFDELPDEDQL